MRAVLQIPRHMSGCFEVVYQKEIAEIDAEFEIAEGKRKADFRKRSEEFDRETEEKLRKIRAAGNEMKKKSGKRIIKDWKRKLLF
jgi:hypothetical protein